LTWAVALTTGQHYRAACDQEYRDGVGPSPKGGRSPGAGSGPSKSASGMW